MIGYKDKTFCIASKCINWNVCSRALTEEVQKAAEKWWGNATPPFITFSETPDCYERKEE